jgi:NAD-dependent deacetylase
MMPDKLALLTEWIYESHRLVVFTGAGISTDSGIRDFRGPDGIWTRRDKGLDTPRQDFAAASPNAGHHAIAELERLGKLDFLISQNVDNLHLRSSISPDRIAELHGNLTKVRCTGCAFVMDRMEGEELCPLCGGRLVSTVVDFGQPLPEKDLTEAYEHARHSDCFIVAGSSLVVYPAADIPRVALEAGAKLVIINREETPYDGRAHLRFYESATDVLCGALGLLKELMKRP